MVYDDQLLDLLESIGGQPFEGNVWRVTFDGQSPLRPNIRGARWNPKDCSALYTSTSIECVRIEFQQVIDLQPVRPTPSAAEYTLEVRLGNVLDLTSRSLLKQLGIDLDGVIDDSVFGYPPFQRVGGAAQFLGYEGLLVPSIRLPDGVNLVIYADNVQPVGTSDVVVIAQQPFQSPGGAPV